MKFITFILFLFTQIVLARGPIEAGRFQHLSGIKNNTDTKIQWDKKYNTQDYVYGKRPAEFLEANLDFLPSRAEVLDVGMGEGRNAIFLAQKGFKVVGIDISSVAIKKAEQLASENKVKIKSIEANLKTYKFKPHSFDVIICFYFVDRELIPKMLDWLKPGGVIFFEAYTDNQLKVKGFERQNRNYLLRPGELLTLFKGYQILKFEEPLHRAQFTASLIVRKP